MNNKLCLRMCREVFAEQPWFLLEHGTILIGVKPMYDGLVLQAMKRFDALIGPHGGEGTPYGDCTPMPLKSFDGWLVKFTLPLHTFVGADEVEEAMKLPGSATEFMRRDEADVTQSEMQELRVAQYGRHKRNMDARDPKIIARSTDP